MVKDDFYGKIKGVDKKVSRIFFGTAIMPMLCGKDCNDLLNSAFDCGITAFDTARNYAGAEISLGKWIGSHDVRDKIVILSKCGHPDEMGNRRITEKEVRADFNKSCEYLNTDYIDIYLYHRDDTSKPVDEAVEIMNALYSEGKIKTFGASNWSHERIAEANEYAYKHSLVSFTVSSPNFGLAHQITDPWGGGCVTISGSENERSREWYKQNNMPVVAYSALGRGLFSGRLKYEERQMASTVLDVIAMRAYDVGENFERLRRVEIIAEKRGLSVAQVALKWIFTQGLDVYAVVSCTSAERIKSNAEALFAPMTEKEADYLNLKADCYE